jgi:hypothetical protein
MQELTKVLPFDSSYKTTRTERLSPGFEDDARRQVEKQELESLRQVGQVFRRSRKRKLMVWLTGYFPISVANRELTYGDNTLPYGQSRNKIRSDMTPLFQAAIDSLNHSRIAVFPAFVVDAHNYDVQRLAKDSLDGLTEVAQRTGGRMLGVLDQIDFFSSIADVRQHFDSYYVLTFNLQSARKDSWVDSNIRGSQLTACLPWSPMCERTSRPLG